MIRKLIAYDLDSLEKHKVLKYAQRLFKNQLITDEQFKGLKSNYSTTLFTPSIAVKVLLFLAGLVGTSTLMGPIVLLSMDGSLEGIRVMMFITGIIIILLNEQQIIRANKHFKSGLTESLLYIGFGFVYFGILADSSVSEYVYLGIGVLFSIVLTVRYLDLLSLVLSIMLTGAMLFNFCYNLGGVFQSIIPFVFMIYSGMLFLAFRKIEVKVNHTILETHFIVGKTITLLLFYLSGNYFVVRELSVELMNLDLLPGENIPFYFIFYAWTALVPAVYMFVGIKNKNILFIRLALLCLTLSVVTLKIYFSLGMPIVTITISGAISITVALLLMRYLKKNRFGYTRSKLFQKDWHSEEITAFTISQTAGGTPQSEEELYGGGSFGGGGAGSEF